MGFRFGKRLLYIAARASSLGSAFDFLLPSSFSVAHSKVVRNGQGLSFENQAELPNPGVKKAYDDENRLSIVQSNTVYYSTNYPLWQNLYAYDGLGRLRVRVERQNMVTPGSGGGGEEESLVYGGEESLESGGGGTIWGTNSITEYIYDGWRVIQERDGSNVPTVSYTRGTDLSGMLEGAGGIGGLLARSHGYSAGNWSTNNFYHADGNGNVTYLVSSSQALAARYRYDPYGNLISSTETLGYLGTPNTYRFSSKMADLKTDLYYYGYRWYSPSLHRWMNQDPIREFGGVNLYGFVDNDPILGIDLLGLQSPPTADWPRPGPLFPSLFPELKPPSLWPPWSLGPLTLDPLPRLTPPYTPSLSCRMGGGWSVTATGDPAHGGANGTLSGPVPPIPFLPSPPFLRHTRIFLSGGRGDDGRQLKGGFVYSF